jgi:hypothetical protein
MKKQTHDTLFDLSQIPSDPTRSIRHERAEQVRAWKKEYGIQTNHCEDDWMAVSMNEACERLKDYDLTDDEKSHLACLMAGYCRLLDDGGMIAEGHKTEYEACEALVRRLNPQQ